MYKCILNNIDVTNLLVSIPDKKQAKKWGEDVFLPEFEFEFSSHDMWLSKSQIKSMVNNTYMNDFYLEFSKDNDVLIRGNNLDIQENYPTATMVIGTLNEKFKESVEKSFIKQNPAYIVKKIAESFNVSVNPVYYRKTYGKLKKDKIRFTVIPTPETKLHDVISEIAKKAGLDIYLANDELIIDSYIGKNESAFTLLDNHVISAKLKTNKNDKELYTNFSVVTSYNDATYTDLNTGNIFADQRKEYGDKPFDELSGALTDVVRYPDIKSGVLSMRNFLEHYSRELVIGEISLPIEVFSGLRLDTIFLWYSDYFRFEKRFSVREINYKYSSGIISATIEEITNIAALDSINGFGTSWGESFGEK